MKTKHLSTIGENGQGNYFRIEDMTKPRGRSKADYRKVTYFNNIDRDEQNTLI